MLRHTLTWAACCVLWTRGDHAGAGIGVRYKTPIGPLRFDIAAPVSGKTGNGVQVYLGLGQAF